MPWRCDGKRSAAWQTDDARGGRLPCGCHHCGRSPGGIRGNGRRRYAGGCGTVAARFSDAHVAAAGGEQVPEKQDQYHHRRRVLSLFFPWFLHIPPLYFCHENRDCPAAVRRRLPSGFIFPDSVMLESCMPERTGATPSSRSLQPSLRRFSIEPMHASQPRPGQRPSRHGEV